MSKKQINNNNAKIQEAGQNKKKKKKKHKKLRIFLLTILIIILAAAAFLTYKVIKNGGGLQGFLVTMVGNDEETLKNLDRLDFILMGESEVDGYKLADSIMVCSYDPKTQQASMLSIPRDTYVGKKNKNTATQNYLASCKINTVYRAGEKIQDAIDGINLITGLNIKHYLIIDTKALVQLVDAIGGVNFNVPIDMDYEDSSQDLYIHLKAGEQKLNGSQAEQVVRFRHNDDGSSYPEEYGDQDIGRMRTQREFLTAVMKQTLVPQNIFKIKQIMDIAFNNVKTNIDLGLAKDYVPYSVNFNTENLKTGTLPGEPEQVNGVWIYTYDKTQTPTLVEELFPSKVVENTDTGNTVNTTTPLGTSVKTETLRVEILNGSGTSSNLSKLTTKLKEKGYNVVKTGTTSSTAKTSIINRTAKSSQIESDIKKVIGAGTVTSGDDNSNVDFTVIIGKDY